MVARFVSRIFVRGQLSHRLFKTMNPSERAAGRMASLVLFRDLLKDNFFFILILSLDVILLSLDSALSIIFFAMPDSIINPIFLITYVISSS